MEDEGELDFNFWPSFADLMLSLVLILVLVLFLVMAVISTGTVNLKAVRQNQQDMVKEIADSYGTKAVELRPDVVGIWTTGGTEPDIRIKNEPTFQQITFSEGVLFPPDEYILNDSGRRVLKSVGGAIKNRLGSIERIQIEGHADREHTKRHGSNVRLAALRAIEVFGFLQDPKGLNIDPSRHLMSATSFGEFNPVQRAQGEGPSGYDSDRLTQDNDTKEKRGRNRRIELLLFYRR